MILNRWISTGVGSGRRNPLSRCRPNGPPRGLSLAFSHDAAMPFGGYRMHGCGRESGVQALDPSTKVKVEWMKIASGRLRRRGW